MVVVGVEWKVASEREIGGGGAGELANVGVSRGNNQVVVICVCACDALWYVHRTSP